MTATTRKARTTLADLMAAAALGAIDPDTTEVLTAHDADAAAAAAARDAAAAAPTTTAAAVPVLDPSTHVCNAAGCRHGAAHGGTVQPDRQVKLLAPCGAVARMTTRALTLAGGTIRCDHGDAFAPAARRQYRSRNAAQ